MSATLIQIKDGLKTRIETITDFSGRVFDYVPGTQEPPSVTIVPGTFVPGDTKAAITYDRTFSGASHDYVFTLAVVVSRAAPDRLVAEKLDQYLASSGAKSIKAAIEGDDTLGGIVSFTKVDRVIQYGALTWNGQSFFGAQIICEVTG